jgi:hypothetical protein
MESHTGSTIESGHADIAFIPSAGIMAREVEALIF